MTDPFDEQPSTLAHSMACRSIPLRHALSAIVLLITMAQAATPGSAALAVEGKVPKGWTADDPTAGADGWAKKATDPASGITFILVAPGTFMMGSPDQEKRTFAAEHPQHEVRITKPFYLGETEVTQAQWFKVLGANPSKFIGDVHRPAEKISWNAAQDFCNKVGYRLPTEAEWEYAYRAGTTTRFYTGNTISSAQAHFSADFVDPDNAKKGAKLTETAPVGSYPPNPWGFKDIAGNVWELVADTYDPDFYKTSPHDDPYCSTQSRVVMRGGAWCTNASSLRAAIRLGVDPLDDVDLIGCRVAKSLP